MEEDNDCDAMESQLEDGNQIHHFQLINSPNEIEKEEAVKKYKLLNVTRSRIKEDITQRQEDEHQINLKLMWFYQHHQYIRWKTQQIMHLERCLGKPEIHLVSRTGFYRLPEKDAPASVRPDRKRSQKRLIKKGRVDTCYLQQVQEELLSSKKSGGITPSDTQEVNDLMESMAQRIQHGNKNRADEMRIYHEMRNVKETKEMYAAPEPNYVSNNYWYSRERKSNRDIESQRSIQHKIHILLDEIEEIKMDLKRHKARVTRLKTKLELVRKSIRCLKKELEHVSTKRSKAMLASLGCNSGISRTCTNM